jgi:hypothetical protein
MNNVILSFALGFIGGGFLTLIVVLIFDKFHKHNYQLIRERYVYDSRKIRFYTELTVQCNICGKVKIFKIKH